MSRMSRILKGIASDTPHSFIIPSDTPFMEASMQGKFLIVSSVGRHGHLAVTRFALERTGKVWTVKKMYREHDKYKWLLEAE